MEELKKSIIKYWNDRPCNIRHSKLQIGTKEYFDEVYNKKFFVENHAFKLANYGGKINNSIILDAGCGIGTFSQYFIENGAKYVIGLDISSKSIEIAKQRAEVYGYTNKSEFHTVDMENMEEYEFYQKLLNEKEENKIDYIWCFGVLHHTPNPEKIVDKLQKISKKTSDFVGMVYSKISYKGFSMLNKTCFNNNIDHFDMSIYEKNIQYWAEAQENCPLAKIYSFKDVKNLMKNTKWVYNIFLYKKHIFIWDIEKYKENIYEKSEEWKNVDDSKIKEFEKELGWHTCFVFSAI